MSLQNSMITVEGRRRQRRARLVCVRCHEKKIKCDLQEFSNPEGQRCTGCVESRVECRVRRSQRGSANKRIDSRHSAWETQARLPPQDNPAQTALQAPHTQPALESASALGLDNPPTSPRLGLSSAPINSGCPATAIPLGQPIPEHRSGQLRTAEGNNEPPIVTPGQQSQSSQSTSRHAAYLGTSGFMSIFSQEQVEDEDPSHGSHTGRPPDQIAPVLQESYLDTYDEFCYTWCPILDRETLQSCPEFSGSVLLRQALALLGSHLKPPLMAHIKPRDHYIRFRQLFYDNHETHPLVKICALMLVYWWSSGPPNVASIDTNWWWMGASIRLAQEVGLHREKDSDTLWPPEENQGLRRRIWWTLVARDRLTSIMQGRPCAIDLDYCDVRRPTAEDFPDPHSPKAEIFIQWVGLCEIIGHVGKAIAQGNPSARSDLLRWVQELPAHLQLPISNDRTTAFSREVHLMHLPYLATITLLHLRKTSRKLPAATKTAIIAASCVARIFEDLLGRGNLRFMPGQAGWYITVSLLALLYARQIEPLRIHAEVQIAILRTALEQMAIMWHSSKMFFTGFEKIFAVLGDPLVKISQVATVAGVQNSGTKTSQSLPSIEDVYDEVNWTDFFPYVTTETSSLVSVLVENTIPLAFTEIEDYEFPSLFDFLGDFDPGLLQMNVDYQSF